MTQSTNWTTSSADPPPPSSRRRVEGCEKGPRFRFLFQLDATLDKYGKRLERGWPPVGSDPSDVVEAIHDLRVSSRRLRAVVDLMGRFSDKRSHRRAREALRRITRCTGPLRELDVNRQNIVAEMAFSASGPERCALEYLSNALALERGSMAPAARKKFERALRRDPLRWVRESTDMAAAALPKKGLRERARSAVVACADGVFAAAPPQDGVEDAPAMHATRIAVKKLRYTVDLLDPILLAPERIRVRLADAQETLGRYHDLVVLDSLIRRHQEALEREGCHALARGLQVAAERISKERRDVVAEYERIGIGISDADIAELIG